MRIDELHKFSDGTLNDVRTALNDRLKGIQMDYLPQTIWRQSDKDKAGAMIHAIDKQLKTRRIMQSLEKFVDKMDSMHFTLSMYYDYGAHVKGELLVMMKNFQSRSSQIRRKHIKMVLEVTNIAQKDKNEAKRTKPSTGMERVREIKVEGVFIFNGPTQVLPDTTDILISHAGNPTLPHWSIKCGDDLTAQMLMIWRRLLIEGQD
ncbi:hypothetical protein Tco_0226743 [Tanacetum coccineum]